MLRKPVPRLITKIALLLGLVPPLATAVPLSILAEGENCVAYRAKKQWAFVIGKKVTGKSCDLTVQVIPEVGGKYHVEVEIPVQSLTSGEPERDKDVFKTLNGKSHPNIVFRTSSHTADDWKALKDKKRFPVSGELKIGEIFRPIRAEVALSESSGGLEIDGVVNTGFKQLNLKPPQLAGGLVLRVKDELQLHFHFVSRNIMGFPSLISAETD